MSRRTFLVLGGVGFAGVVFSSVAGCRGEGEGSSGVTMTSEAAEPGDSQQTAEISTPRGKVRGVLYPVEGAPGAVLMVGGAGGDITDRRTSTTSWLPACRPEVFCLEYRTPNQLDECVYDLLAGIEALGQHGASG